VAEINNKKFILKRRDDTQTVASNLLQKYQYHPFIRQDELPIRQFFAVCSSVALRRMTGKKVSPP
jgi:hypothetical protein